ncbi:TdeIII family type II restriction endonuclease [Clostridium perfringens]|uniref:TdeIII family type II restriction endonuclease n=1 Tax=Clostridium perfringens TaxID=1502 RepID=UPI001CE00E02|nr:TdeIII family type II restriction endonuclease [Clostridium perfringens]EGT0695577.1 TdeIII family type II restriction endonuclease [Clostridium perfringens]EGT3604497.1 TdeIII family type II restriction endonuclease [Clostridium perfringens]MDH5084433.1 MjaII restriction endonuclease [Clostridium perfringens]HBJ6025067.1 TdeIII family type II restriction endonuclease [Clostridium perfringens]HBJ6108781.1 TdeIII family type II restriction endonuclease [Clostridium perfringens]
MNIETKNKVEEHLREVMKRILEKRTIQEPFNEEDIKTKNPFGYRLVPIEVWKGSKFERSFVTSLGQGIFEQIAKIIAEGSGAIAENQYTKSIKLNSWQLEKIDNILEKQRKQRNASKKKVKDNSNKVKTINEELEFLRELETDRYQEVRVLFDLYIKRENGIEEYYSLKTVKPNLDQTETAKKDMLRLMTAEENSEAYFALPYNPAGEGEIYKLAHSIPYKLFDMDNDKNVLIGKSLWNKIGQSDNTYDELLDIFDRVGEDYISKIREEYFEIK